jgi:MFS family permease
MPSTSSAASHRFFYGWIIVIVTGLTLFVGAGARSAPGVFIVPVEIDTGWSRSAISFAGSVGLLMLGAAGPLSGWLINRFGARRIMLAGLALTSLSMVASSFIHELWQLILLWGALSGMGTGIIGSVIGPSVANRWFFSQRSLIVGIFGASTSAGLLIFNKLLLEMEQGLGWRTSSLWLGAIVALCVLPVLVWMRNKPEDVGILPYGATTPLPASHNQVDGSVMQRALRSPEFWLLTSTFFVCGATSNGLIGMHFIAHATDHGIAKSVAGNTMALMGLMNFVGTIASGWLTDRYDPRKLLCVYYALRGASLFLLPSVTDDLGLSAFAILFGLDYIATVPPTTALVADNFGRRNVGVIYGWIFFAHQIGAASAGWLGGIARDSLGNYVLAFLTAGVIALMAALLSLRIARQPAGQPISAFK